METLFTILFFIVAVVFSTIMKKKQAAADELSDVTPSPENNNQDAEDSSGRESWEDELRRLLQGGTATASPAEMPPPVITPAPAPVRAPSRPAPKPKRLHEWKTAQSARQQRADRSADRASLPHAARAFERAQHLDETVSDQVRDAARRLTLHSDSMSGAGAGSGGASRKEIRRAVDLVRSPESLRTAIIASIILGPPRAMQSPSDR